MHDGRTDGQTPFPGCINGHPEMTSTWGLILVEVWFFANFFFLKGTFMVFQRLKGFFQIRKLHAEKRTSSWKILTQYVSLVWAHYGILCKDMTDFDLNKPIKNILTFFLCMSPTWIFFPHEPIDHHAATLPENFFPLLLSFNLLSI